MQSGESGLSVGSVVGIAVGVAGAFLLVLASCLFFFLRRRARRRAQANDGSASARPATASSQGGLMSFMMRNKAQRTDSGTSTDLNSPYTDAGGYYLGKPAAELGTQTYAYEMDSHHHHMHPAAEMPTEQATAELDGMQAGNRPAHHDQRTYYSPVPAYASPPVHKESADA